MRASVAGYTCLNSSKQTYQGTQIVPHLRNVRVEAYCSGVCVKGVTVLVDLVIEDADRTPERRVASVPVHRLLIGLVSLGIFLLGHVASAQEIPALGVGII